MKKGFTLIELLAVIVVLAIILIIAIPRILNVIEESDKEAFKITGEQLIKGAKDRQVFNTNGPLQGKTYTITDSAFVGEEIPMSGSLPKSGVVTINEEGQVAIAIHNGTYCAEKGYEDSEVTLSDKTKEECTISSEITFACGQDLVDSRDIKVYKTVKIGEQCWMAENLKYTGNGCAGKTWNDTAPHHDACQSHSTDWGEEVLYQWEAAMNGSTTEGVQGLCPDGWHIPTDAEWTTLINFVGTTPGTKLKAITPTWDGTDTVGFNAKPAGYRNTDGSLNNVGSNGYWWTSSISGSDAWYRNLYSGNSFVGRSYYSQAHGNSVRCLLGQ